jgi:hypothetical protein
LKKSGDSNEECVEELMAVTVGCRKVVSVMRKCVEELMAVTGG